MLRPGTQDSYISRRVNLPTEKSHAEIVSDMEPKIKAQSFFSARVAEAHILDKLREVSDGYSRGEFGLGEARNKLKDFLRGEGYDPHQAGLRNLASTARLNLILKQNAAMAHSAAEWHRMHDPDAMKVFPYVRYHARNDSRTRGEHAHLDGRIFRKDDPFLSTHTPPWEFNCRCWLEEITEKEAGKTPALIQPPTPEDKVTVDSRSGFSFDPAHAFEKFEFDAIKDPGLRAKAKDGVEKLLGEVNQPGALDVRKYERFETVGINLQNPDPYPRDDKHRKLRPVYNAIRNSSETDFSHMIASKGANMKREFVGIYDSSGKPLWVGMGPKDVGAANFPDLPKGCTFIHNHPNGGSFSLADMTAFIENDMARMVVSILGKDAEGNDIFHKYTLTKKDSGVKLSIREIEQRLESAYFSKSAFEAWKEALNGSCYEMAYA